MSLVEYSAFSSWNFLLVSQGTHMIEGRSIRVCILRLKSDASTKVPKKEYLLFFTMDTT